MRKISKELRRNPDSVHVKMHHLFRKSKIKPKAVLSPTRGEPLTFRRFLALIEDYSKLASTDAEAKRRMALSSFSVLPELRRRAMERALKPGGSTTGFLKELERIGQKSIELAPALYAEVASPHETYKIASEIISDFGRTKNLKVFGFGVGYGQLLFFLKKFMGAKGGGIDLGNFSKWLTRNKKLGVIHGTSATDPKLTKHGQFDVTYSINVFETDVLRKRETTEGMLDNCAKMTRRGGKSYHIVRGKEFFPFSKEEIESKGFRIDDWNTKDAITFIKLTKLTD